MGNMKQFTVESACKEMSRNNIFPVSGRFHLIQVLEVKIKNSRTLEAFRYRQDSILRRLRLRQVSLYRQRHSKLYYTESRLGLNLAKFSVTLVTENSSVQPVQSSPCVHFIVSLKWATV